MPSLYTLHTLIPSPAPPCPVLPYRNPLHPPSTHPGYLYVPLYTSLYYFMYSGGVYRPLYTSYPQPMQLYIPLYTALPSPSLPIHPVCFPTPPPGGMYTPSGEGEYIYCPMHPIVPGIPYTACGRALYTLYTACMVGGVGPDHTNPYRGHIAWVGLL